MGAAAQVAVAVASGLAAEASRLLVETFASAQLYKVAVAGFAACLVAGAGLVAAFLVLPALVVPDLHVAEAAVRAQAHHRLGTPAQPLVGCFASVGNVAAQLAVALCWY